MIVKLQVLSGEDLKEERKDCFQGRSGKATSNNQENHKGGVPQTQPRIPGRDIVGVAKRTEKSNTERLQRSFDHLPAPSPTGRPRSFDGDQQE